MAEACKDLDEANEKIGKLVVEFQNKAELLDSLRRAYNEQLNKLEETKLLIKKQAQELYDKSTEIYEAGEVYKDIKSKLQDKESVVRQLSSANEKLRADFTEKVQNLEGENRKLVLDLEEAITRNNDFEEKICACTEEIGGLKRLLSVAEKKCLETEKMAQTCKQMRIRYETIENLEEKYRNVQDQLKWKKEQFKHLEEAHKKLHDEFSSSKDDWERQKVSLFEEISSLQTNLDSQTRIAEGFQIQLAKCNQALAHEESKRKLLEVQVSESQSLFDDVHVKCQEAQSKIESLTMVRDEDVANLRNLLGSKDVHIKEMEFKIIYLEQENRELHASLKELQESDINNAGAAFLVEKLRKKLRGVEHIHGSCSKKLEEKESEWCSKLVKLDEEMKNSLDLLELKESHILKLQEDLKGCESSLDLLHEEMDLVHVVLKSEFSEAYSKLRTEFEQKHREVSSMKRAEFDGPRIEEEIKRHKLLHEESSKTQHQLEEHILRMGNALKDASDDLVKANQELNKKVSENCLIEFEMNKWKSIAKDLQVSLEESQDKQNQVETYWLARLRNDETLKENKSLSSLVKEQEMAIFNIRQLLVAQETTSAAKSEEVETLKQATNNYFGITEEKERSIEKLQKEIDGLELESMTRELEGGILARTEAEKSFDIEKNVFIELTKRKDQTIEDLQLREVLLEEDFTNNFSQVTEQLILIQALDEANNLSKVEIEDRNNTITKLENEVNGLRQEYEIKKGLLCSSKQHTKQLENLLEARNAEIKKLTEQYENERRRLECDVEELYIGKKVLLENITKLSLEKEDILTQFAQDSEWIKEFCYDDARMMEMLTKILSDEKELEATYEVANITGENVTELLFPTRKTEERSPLRELNN